MDELSVSKFKATCLAVLERVRQTKQSIVITKFGVPIAEVGPPSALVRTDGWLGSLKGTVTIKGDIIAPAGRASDWDALR